MEELKNGRMARMVLRASVFLCSVIWLLSSHIHRILRTGLMTGFYPLCSVANAEYWGELNFERTLLRESYFGVNSQLRFDVEGIYWFETEVGPTMSVTRFMEVGLYYKHKEIKEAAEWESTHNLCVYETFLREFAGIRFRDRNRFDYEELESFKYRNKVSLKWPFVIYEVTGYYGEYPTIWRVIPSIEEEVFYNFKEKKVDENRLLFGISFELMRQLDFKIAGLLHSQRRASEPRSKWENRGALVTTLALIHIE